MGQIPSVTDQQPTTRSTSRVNRVMTEAGDEARNEEAEPDRPKTIVVGIGASAGGVRALQQLFAALPEKTGAAFVVVVHLDPDMRSELSNILAARTHMPVLQVGNPVPLQPDH